MGRRVRRVPDVQMCGVFFESCDERLKRRTLDDDAFCGHADLPGVEEAAVDEGSSCVFDIGVLEYLDTTISSMSSIFLDSQPVSCRTYDSW